MFIDAVLIWRHRFVTSKTTQVRLALSSYSRYAYIWWLPIFITGGFLVLLK